MTEHMLHAFERKVLRCMAQYKGKGAGAIGGITKYIVFTKI
jgi:hypothetical protein